MTGIGFVGLEASGRRTLTSYLAGTRNNVRVVAAADFVPSLYAADDLIVVPDVTTPAQFDRMSPLLTMIGVHCFERERRARLAHREGITYRRIDELFRAQTIAPDRAPYSVDNSLRDEGVSAVQQLEHYLCALGIFQDIRMFKEMK